MEAPLAVPLGDLCKETLGWKVCMALEEDDDGGPWAEAWIGVRRSDCAEFAAEVLARQFGVRVALPSRADSRRGLDRQIPEALFAALRETDMPTAGDVCLMSVAGRRDGVGAHVGVRVHVGTGWAVLHQRTGGAGELHDGAALGRCGLEIKGWWTWR